MESEPFRPGRICILLVALSVACGQGEGARPDDGPTNPLERVVWADNLLSDTASLRLFAQTSTGVVPVYEASFWPEATEMSIGVAVSPGGSAVAVYEAPTSESGDWYHLYTHYFSPDGKTIAFRRTSSFFNSLCTEILREDSLLLFDADGQLDSEEYVLTDKDDQPISSDGCEFPYRHSFPRYDTWNEFERAYGLAM